MNRHKSTLVELPTIKELYSALNDTRYHPFMSLGVRMIDGSRQPADELAARSHDSAYGTHMRTDQPLRFSQRFDYADRVTMLRELGDDLCPIGHQKELGWHMAQIIEKQRRLDPSFQLTDDDAATLIFTCQIHDMGEMTHDDVLAATGAVVGDIPAGLKTDKDRTVETGVRLFLYERFYSDVDPLTIERAEAIIAHKDTTLLHELFEAAHESQTLETTLRARDVSDQIGWHDGHDVIPLADNTDGRARATLAMGRHVMSDHLHKFERYGHYVHMSDLIAEITPENQIAA